MTLAYVENRYSDKYRLIDHDKTVERNQKTIVARERARLLSLATNKRRRAIEERRTKEEKLEEERREAILAQRREWQNQATIRFQRAHLPPDKREYNKHNRFRSRTPPRSISVEDALRAIQTQKPERPSSFPRHKGRSGDTFQSTSPSPKDENNNSPYFHPHFIHTYSHNGEQVSLRGQNPPSRPVSGDRHKIGNSFASAPSGKKLTPESSPSPQKNHEPSFFRSNSNFDHNSLAKDKLRVITETYNVQPFPVTSKAQNSRPETSSGNSLNSGNSTSTTTIVPIDTSSRSSSSLHQKVYPSPRHAPPERAKGTMENQQNWNSNQKQLPFQIRGQHGMPDAKNSFEKQLELQQKKLLEMQQKTVEDFHKALSNSNELLIANSSNFANTEPSHGDSKDLDESIIAKDSLEVDSNDSDDERPPLSSTSNRCDFSSERPKNPEPFDLDNDSKDTDVIKNNENNDLDFKPHTSHGSRAISAQSKFRTPHSTATVSAQEAKSLMESTDNVDKLSTGTIKAKSNDISEPSLEQGSNEDIKNNVVQKSTTNVIKRKPLPINQANTVSKNTDRGRNIGTDRLAQSPMTNSNSSNGSEPSNAKTLKQEPGPTTAINGTANVNNGIPAKTPLQYIAYTPIRKWDSPGTTSPKPVAEVAPVLTTAPNSGDLETSAPEINKSEQPSSGNKNTNSVHPTSSKSDVMDETQLKYSAKTYMSSISHPNMSEPVAIVGHVIDPHLSIFNNQKSSKESALAAGDQTEEQNGNIDLKQEASEPQEVPETSSGSSIGSQKSMIPVPIGKEANNKISTVEQSNADNFSQPKTHNDVRRAYSAEERRSSDGSIGSQRSRPEIRSSSPFDRLVDGSNADDIEELQAPEEIPPRPKSILKRVSSLENCNQFNIKDSLDLGNIKKASRKVTPVTEKPSSAKRSVRFAETIQVQSKAEIDERLPISQARVASARERSADTSDKSAPRRPPRNVTLKPATSQNVPTEIEQIRATQQGTSTKDADFSMTKTPTDDEINALWESIRETMPEKSRRVNSSPDNSSHKTPLYISNGGSNAYYNNYIKSSTQTNPPTIANQYIDGSNLFVESSPYQPVTSQASVARPVSATTVPRKQHLLGHRHQQSASKAVSPHVTAKTSTYQNGAMIAGSFSNQTNGFQGGNHVPFSFAPKSSAAPPLASGSAQQAVKNGKQPCDMTSSLAQFMAAEDLSKMSLTEAQIEDVLHQLQSRQHVTQLSLEEQKLLMSLEHLNNKLKFTEARYKGIGMQ